LGPIAVRHLQFLRSLPDGTVLKNALIATAEQRIAEKKQGGRLPVSPRRIALNSALEENSMPSPKRAQRDFFGATRRTAALSHPAEVGTSLERPEVLAQRFAAQERYDRSRRAVDRDQEAEATPQTRSMASQPAPKENISDQASPESVWWTESPPMSATLQMWDKYLAALKSSPKNLLLRKEVIESGVFDGDQEAPGRQVDEGSGGAFSQVRRQTWQNPTHPASIRARRRQETTAKSVKLYRAGRRPLLSGLGAGEPFAGSIKNSEIGTDRSDDEAGSKS
jgi:hypothetical protein